MATNDFLIVHPEVKDAIMHNKPVVALESTIISHGMPWPINVETAIAVEDAVRKNGAVPATIGIRNGKCIVGMTNDDLEFFGKEKDVWKVSIRDMPYVIVNNIPGATTVAATMRIASIAGIKIFATGGIGGVHRNGENTLDISADLTEMAQTNVAVISAGVKSILDIGLTLEYLETQGIPVVTFGSDEFPSFYSSKSGFKTPLRMDDPEKIAEMLYTKWSMSLDGAVLVANPLLSEAEVEQEIMEKFIISALEQAEKQKITGKEVTPFLLRYIADHTKGESLEANISLIKNNACLAAKIAVAASKISI